MRKMGRREERHLSGLILVDFPDRGLVLRCKYVNPVGEGTRRHMAHPNRWRLLPKDIPTDRGPTAFQVQHLRSLAEVRLQLWR